MASCESEHAPLNAHERGSTPYFPARSDARFGYYLHVPRDFAIADAATYRLCVVVHGSGRSPAHYRDLFVDFAEANRVVVIAPLFPAGPLGSDEFTNYKFLAHDGVHYDRLLNAMIDEVADHYRLAERRVLMFGFSGGGQFAHRYAYLHARRLIGLSVGAPGVVTLLDEHLPWWRGTAGMAQALGAAPDVAGLREVPVQLVAGAEDRETWEITLTPRSRLWMEGANDAGRTRLDRLAALAASLTAHGVTVETALVPGVAHDGHAVLAPVHAFLARVLAEHRA